MASNGQPRGPMRNESEFLKLIQRQASDAFRVSENEIGIGDDAAVISTPGESLVMTADAMVDGVHFNKGQISWHDVGWKSVVSNQSDVAAMGASPGDALVTLAITEDESSSDVEQLFEGIIGALRKFGGRLMGGDTVSSEVMSIGIAMTGVGVSARSAMRRDAARPGDRVAVTGHLGGSAGGLAVLTTEDGELWLSEEDRSALLAAHFTPVPRTDLVTAIRAAEVSCAIDVSDGLIIDLQRVCVASGVNAVVRVPDVPVHESLLRAFSENAAQMAISGGEDYELIYAADRRAISQVNSAQSPAKSPDFGIIGEFVEPPDGVGGVVTVLDERGDAVHLETMGWDHFAR